MSQISEDIIAAARASMKAWRVLASVSLAQYALESGWGAHCPGNNPFGIKALPNHEVQHLMTTEVIKGQVVHIPQPFAVFASIEDAFDEHAHMIARLPVYAPAMAALPDRNRFIDLMAAHYATDPLYASKLKAVIEQHQLDQYDLVPA